MNDLLDNEGDDQLMDEIEEQNTSYDVEEDSNKSISDSSTNRVHIKPNNVRPALTFKPETSEVDILP